MNAYSKEEMRNIFLAGVEQNVHYWASLTDKTDREKCEGVAFSIMVMLDGSAGCLPCAVDLSLSPNPDDKQFHIDEGEKYVEAGMLINDDVHLHDLIFKDRT
jgi:hypothetical protein